MDATNTPIAQAGVIVSVALYSGSPALSGTTTATTDANGRATFTNLTLTGLVGDRILIFAAPDFVSVVSDAITVVAGSATALQMVTQPPSTAQSGVLLDPQPAVRVVDQSGNPVADAGRQITAALVGGGTLHGTATMATEPDGIVTFTDLAVSGTVSPPNRTLSFTSAGLTGVSSAPITLLTGPAARLTLTTQPPTTATSGEALNPQPQVQLRDSGDNPVAEEGVVITAVIASSPEGTSTLTNHQATTDASGLATFSGLTLTGPAGAYTLRFETGALAPVTSGTITLGAGDETQLTITTAPSSSAQSGVALATQPAIQLRDAGGNPVASTGRTVTAVIATSPGGTPTLENATATTDATGLATFSGLAISGLIGDYTLRFESGALTPATSGTISLSEGPVATLVFFTAPSTTAQSGVALSTQPVVRTLDSGGNNLNGVVVTASVSPGGTLLGTVTATSGPPQARAAFTDPRDQRAGGVLHAHLHRGQCHAARLEPDRAECRPGHPAGGRFRHHPVGSSRHGGRRAAGRTRDRRCGQSGGRVRRHVHGDRGRRHHLADERLPRGDERERGRGPHELDARSGRGSGEQPGRRHGRAHGEPGDLPGLRDGRGADPAGDHHPALGRRDQRRCVRAAAGGPGPGCHRESGGGRRGDGRSPGRR
jgi:hypothetical protein